uniref:Putative replicase n=1 Tax=Katsystermes virus TaxID=2796601 RepID=A0A7T7K8T4_9VIRU|nr:putative replicase [Katsystermes virus]
MAQSSSTKSQGARSARARIVIPTSLASIRAKFYGGNRNVTLYKDWCRGYTEWLGSLGLIADTDSFERLMRTEINQFSGSTEDLRANLWMNSSPGTVQGDRKALKEGKSFKSYEEVLQPFISGWRSNHGATRLNQKGIDTLFTELESENVERFGPRSMWRGYPADGPAKVLALLDTKRVSPKLDVGALRETAAIMAEGVKSGSLQLRTYEDVTKAMSTDSAIEDPATMDPNTYSGVPFFKMGWRPTEGMSASEAAYSRDVLQYYLRKCKIEKDQLSKGELINYIAVLGNRHNVPRGLKPLESEKLKRVIWMMPKNNAMHWKTITVDALAQLRTYRLGPSRSLAHVAWEDIPVIDLELQRFMNYCEAKNLPILSMDFDGFDSTIVPDVWATIVEPWDRWTNSGKFISSLAKSTLWGLGLITPTEFFKPGISSLPSGSGDTNFVGSHYNKAVAIYGDLTRRWKLEGGSFMGDDSYGAGEGLDPDTYQEVASELGLVASASKQLYAKGQISYLHRLHMRGMLGGMYSSVRALNYSIALERLAIKPEWWNPYMQAIQVIAKLMNAAFNPAFEYLVKYVASGDRWRLGAVVSPQQVVSEAGHASAEILHDFSTINATVQDSDLGSWCRNVANRVLREGSYQLPLMGSPERFIEVYGQERVSNAEEKVGMSVKDIMRGKY